MDPSRLFEALRRPFEPSDLEWRAMYSTENERGPLILVAPYVQRPALINRLNQVCGIGGWASDVRASAGVIKPGKGKDPDLFHGHVMVGVGVLVGDVWVWRWDGTGPLQADGPYFTPDSAGKGDFSAGFKRACEQFGIATYLREIRPMRAIINEQGRYKQKIGQKTVKWDPPGLQGQPSYPGEIPGFALLEEGGEPSRSSNGGGIGPAQTSAPPAPPTTQPEKSEEEKEKDEAAQLEDAKLTVRTFLRENGYRVYHLDAFLQVTGHRFGSADELGRKGGLDDWLEILPFCEKMKAMRWEEAPKQLAGEYPTGPERLQLLDKLLDSVKVDSRELIEIETQKRIGWNDAIEYWINDLSNR